VARVIREKDKLISIGFDSIAKTLNFFVYDGLSLSSLSFFLFSITFHVVVVAAAAAFDDTE
jgi:hypothetical protein